MRSLHILDTVRRVQGDFDHYEGQFQEHDEIDENLFPRHTRLG